MKKNIFIILFLNVFLSSCLVTTKLPKSLLAKDDNVCQEIKIVANPYYPPFSLINEEEYVGFGVDAVQHILEKTAVSYRFIKTDSWNKSVEMILKGEADLIIGAYYNSDADFLNYVRPYIATDNAMVWAKKGFISKLETSEISKLKEGREIYLGFSSKSKCQNWIEDISKVMSAIKETSLIDDLMLKSIKTDKWHSVVKTYKNQPEIKKIEESEKKSALEPINLLSF